MLEQDIKKVLVSHEEIVTAAKKLGQQLTADYQGKKPIFVGILKGSVPFMAELIKHVDTDIELDIIAKTVDTPHHTVTPIARKVDGKYEMDIVLIKIYQMRKI